MRIPQECINYHIQHFSLDDVGHTSNSEKDDEMTAKMLLSIHYEYKVKTGEDPDGMLLMDHILNKISRYIGYNGYWHIMPEKEYIHRSRQVQMAKEMIIDNKLNYIDAVRLLFSLEEMNIYGL